MSARLRDLRPTHRGTAVAVVVAAAFVLGATTGARSLNAVVVPGIVALVAGGVQLAMADDPTIDRSKPDPGFPGETPRVSVTVESPVPVTVTETVTDRRPSVDGSGSRNGGISIVDSEETTSATVGHGGTFEYEVEYARRGKHALGPATVRRTDSLGLFTVEETLEGSTSVLVYPSVYRIEGDYLGGLVQRVLGTERTSFDRLREYTPGDSMRDIHWRASAKRDRDEFVVAEYRSRSDDSSVSIVGESSAGTADEVASTVASVAAHLHEAGITVSVTVPGGTCLAHPGDAAPLLGLLAVMGGGGVDASSRAGADVHVRGSTEGVTVALADREMAFEQLAGSRRIGRVAG